MTKQFFAILCLLGMAFSSTHSSAESCGYGGYGIDGACTEVGASPYQNDCKTFGLQGQACEDYMVSMNSGKLAPAKPGSASAGDKYSTCQNVCQADATARCYAACMQAVPKVNACIDETKAAVDTCDTQKSGDMNNVMGILSAAGQAIGGAQASQQTACSSFGKILPAISAGIGAFQGYCSAGYADCSSSCSDAYDMQRDFTRQGMTTVSNYIKQNIEDPKKDCGRLQQILASAVQNAGVAIASLMNTNKCEEQSQDLMGQFCSQNPSSSICGQQKVAVDCNDPNAAVTNTICICQKNPRDSRCGFNAGSGVQASTSSGGVRGTDGTASGSSLDPGGMGVDPFSGVQQRDPRNAGGGGGLPSGGGGRSGGGIQGGGTGSPGAGAGGGAAAGGLATKVLNGYVGGSGGGGYGGGSGSARDSDGQNGGGSGGYGVGKNLNAFLPKGQMDPKRNLAGVTGPDGLTGPNSNNWEKVNIRYHWNKPNFKP